MSNTFAGKTSVKGEKAEADYIPTGGGALPTGIYPAKIKVAYLQKSQSSKATSVVFLLDVNGTEVRNQIWASNRNGDITYKDKTSGKLKNLPGFNQVNSVCLLVAGKELGQMDDEELAIKLYDYTAKAEILQTVTHYPELRGEKIQVALQKQIVDKTRKNESTDSYEPTGETREVNEVIKVFPEDKLVTISEVTDFIESLGSDLDSVIADGSLLKGISKTPERPDNFASIWLEKFKGKDRDRSTGAKGGAPTPGKPLATAAPSASTVDLFDD